VRTAIMPQPMSTPTAAGMTARCVGTTVPTVAPLPRWTVGHDGDVAEDDRQAGQVQDLAARGVLDVVRREPGDRPVADLVSGHGSRIRWRAIGG
jgi:hypothetical protein